MNKTKYDNKPFLRYSEALTESLMSKRMFDRLFIFKGDHFCIDDDDYVLFSKDFLDEPQGRKVFAEDGPDLGFCDKSMWVYTPEKRKNSRIVGGKWLSYQAAIDYSGLTKEEFDSRYIFNDYKFRIRKGKLKIEWDYIDHLLEKKFRFSGEELRESDADRPDYGQWLNAEEAALYTNFPIEVVLDTAFMEAGVWDSGDEYKVSLLSLDRANRMQGRWYKESSDKKNEKKKGGKRK